MSKFNSWCDKWIPLIAGFSASTLILCYVVLPAVQQLSEAQEPQSTTRTR